MDKTLCSVGLDVGTTTTQLIVSRLTAQNRAPAFAAPRMEITHRQPIYRSPVYFTPLLRDELVDGKKLRELVAREYARAGIRREQVDTGAVIVTGETSRKENAAAVAAALSDLAGDFVVAAAGPDLESVLAAKGAGSVALSQGRQVLHMDIGGGTSNLAVCDDGAVTATGCLNVGGRLLKFDPQGTVTYVSPVLRGLAQCRPGQRMTEAEAMELARFLARVLEMAAGLRPREEAFWQLRTPGTEAVEAPPGAVLSFSGGVADCIAKEVPWLAYGDLGPLLGRAIRQSRLCAGDYRLGTETVRATVIGAGCHATQLSGSTVFVQNVSLPLKDLPVAALTAREQALPPEALTPLIAGRLEALEQWGVLALPGWNAPAYGRVTALAGAIAAAVGRRPCYVALEADMAKALGHALALRLPAGVPCLCLDGIHIPPQSYLDMGASVGPAVCVTVKTLIFEK